MPFAGRVPGSRSDGDQCGVDGVVLGPDGTLYIGMLGTTGNWDKVPQMGWNNVKQIKQHAAFDSIDDNSEFYFVHSYYPAPSDDKNVLARTDYAGVSFASVVTKGNVIATQFHPEKSGRIGLAFLKNFLSWRPGEDQC